MTGKLWAIRAESLKPGLILIRGSIARVSLLPTHVRIAFQATNEQATKPRQPRPLLRTTLRRGLLATVQVSWVEQAREGSQAGTLGTTRPLLLTQVTPEPQNMRAEWGRTVRRASQRREKKPTPRPTARKALCQELEQQAICRK